MRLKYRRCVVYFTLLVLYSFLSVIYLQSSDQFSQNELFAEYPDWEYRLEKVESTCNSTPVLLPRPKQLDTELPPHMEKHFMKIFYKNLLFNIVRIPALKLDWCLVPKVSSTSLSKLLLDYLPSRPVSPAAGRRNNALFVQKELWERAGHLVWDDYLQAKNNVRFLISRHPFGRLASAYRNKLEDKTRSHDGQYFYNTYSKQIIRATRGHFDTNSKEPSFKEFIEYLLKTDVQEYDEHWQPIALRCRVCQLEYTHILRHETFSSEWEYFLESAGVNISKPLPWENQGVHGSLTSYFKDIPREMQVELAKKYAADFKMFDYTLDDDF